MKTLVPPYEPVCSLECDVSATAVSEALGRVGYYQPTLFVAQDLVGIAVQINQRFGHLFNIEIIHEPRDVDEWWVTFNGRAVGSAGA